MPANNADCPVTTNPTGPQSLQLIDGQPYDPEEPFDPENAQGGGPTSYIIVQTPGQQTSPCIENPLPPRVENNLAITGGQLP